MLKDPYHDILCNTDGEKWIAVARHKETQRINYYVSHTRMWEALKQLSEKLKEHKE